MKPATEMTSYERVIHQLNGTVLKNASILFYLEEPIFITNRETFDLKGWIISQTPVRRMLLRSGKTFELNMAERPDVSAAYPSYPHAVGFSRNIPAGEIDPSGILIQCETDSHVRSYEMILDQNMVQSIKRTKILSHLACPICRHPLDVNCPELCQQCGQRYAHEDHRFYFMTEDLGSQFGVIDSDRISRNPYDLVAHAIIQDQTDGLILDCGAGFRERDFANVINLDIKAYESTDIVAINERLPFQDDTFDAVFSLAVLEHTRNPFQAAAEISRVLKPDGLLYCVAPLLVPVHAYPNHYFNMTGQGLRSLFEPSLDILCAGVPDSGHPGYAISWILRTWADALPEPERMTFLDLKVADLVNTSTDSLRPFVSLLDEGKKTEIASTTMIIGRKALNPKDCIGTRLRLQSLERETTERTQEKILPPIADENACLPRERENRDSWNTGLSSMEISLNQDLESQLKEELTRHFAGMSYWNAAEAAEASLSLGGAESRFQYLKGVLPPEIFTPASKVLVSGMSAGSEMLAARKYGCGEIYGTEVDPFFMRFCQRRFEGMDGMHPFLYDGDSLPWETGRFDLVVSGHIIEHTPNPFLYLKEHLRVLRGGGFLFLEFPTRFHRKELHTSLPSLEWLPSLMRNGALRILSSRLSPLDKAVRQKYRTILVTGLKQVSLIQIRFWTMKAASGARIIHQQKPLPGFVRCVIRKRS